MKKLILANISILFIILIFLEICFSVIFYIKDEKNPLVLSKSVTDFPYVYYTFISEDKKNPSIINEDGLYTYYSRKKPKDTIRIILIGGSTARGMLSSSYDSTISAVLEKLLRKEFPDKNIEVVNAGMSGYVIEQLFIFYQLILSKYTPDIVIGLNGYNDLISVKLNRYTGIYFAPQNMQQFKIIEEGKAKRTFVGRLSNVFPSTFRMANFIKKLVFKQSQYDYSTFNDTEIRKASADYINIIKDIHSFCNAKGVVHFEFLQPIKWYVKENKKESIKRRGISQFVDLYASYEKGLAELDYGHTLTAIFNNKEEIFRDDCHFSDEGNELVASAIASYIKEILIKKTNK